MDITDYDYNERDRVIIKNVAREENLKVTELQNMVFTALIEAELPPKAVDRIMCSTYLWHTVLSPIWERILEDAMRKKDRKEKEETLFRRLCEHALFYK